MKIHSARFVTSASKLSQCPEDLLSEIAFIGRSNVGKSSVINMLVNQNKLAKSSVKPGKTQLINFFLVNELRYLVDLPGYGYAKVDVGSRKKWMDMIQDYLIQREGLKLVFVLIDASIPPQKIDLEFVQTLEEEAIHFALIFNKIDKAPQKKIQQHVKLFRQ